MYLLYLYTTHTSYESLGGLEAMHEAGYLRLQTLRLSVRLTTHPGLRLLSGAFGYFQGQLDCHFFFSYLYSRAGGEDGFVYNLLPFLSSRLYATSHQEDKSHT